MQETVSKVKPTVLILCTGNSCRSHLAEGILRAAAGEFLNVQSAGSKPAGYVHPLAIQVMKEIGIDISAHRSKHMNDFLGSSDFLVGKRSPDRKGKELLRMK
jgi:arsenate reductase